MGNHCLAMALDFAELGHTCELFAQRATSPDQPVRPLADLLSGMAAHTPQDLLLVSYSIYDPYLLALLKLPGRKVAYFHGITPPELLHQYDPVTAYNCSLGYAQLSLLCQFDRVVVNSAFNLRELQQHIPGGMETDRCSVVPPISDRFPLFAQERRTPRAMPAAGQPVNLLTVGRVMPHKCIDDLIKVVALLTKACQPAHLHVVGSCHNPGYLNFLQDSINHYGLLTQVHFHGTISVEDLITFYQTSDFLLVASHHEGFCVPVVEAMHLGLPVVVRSGTAAVEVAAAAGQAFEEPAQAAAAVLDILRSDAMVESMVKAGYERSKRLISTSKDFPFD